MSNHDHAAATESSASALESYDDEYAVMAREQQQYLVFLLAGERLALPLEAVAEIIRSPAITPIPLSPPALLGLLSLRGRVLPVACLRQLAGLSSAVAEEAGQAPDESDEQARRVLILRNGGGLGLQVDQVQKVFSTEPPASDDEAESADNGLVTRGTLREGDSLIQLLDCERMLSRELGDWQAMSGEAALASGVGADESEAEPGQRASDEGADRVILQVQVGGQLFGLDATAIGGILECPEQITPVPRTPEALKGVALLRGRNRPVFSLPQLLGLEGKPSGGHVILLRGQQRRERLALAVDSVAGVIRLAERELESVPALLADAEGDFSALYRDPDNGRLMTLIDLERFSTNHDLGRLTAALADEDASERGKGQASEGQEESGQMQQFVVFELAEQSFAARIEAVREILRLPNSLTGVPAADGQIEGVINLRGRVLPVIDMRRRFDLPVAERDESQRVLVLNIQGQRTGFIVDSVSEVMKVSEADISPASQLSVSRADWVDSVIRCESSKGMVLVLDEQAILGEEVLETLRAVS